MADSVLSSPALHIKEAEPQQSGADVPDVFSATQLWPALHLCAAAVTGFAQRCVCSALQRGVCVSSQWQLPKVLNAPLRERRPSRAFVLLLSDTHGSPRSPASILCPVMSDLLTPPPLTWG